MPSTNGHGPKRAVLYARVSTRAQAEEDRFSLPQQLHALRKYAEENGLEIVEEVTDPAYSGATLERPGLDHVRDLVAAGGVSVVLAQDRDRFAREPAYHYVLRREFEAHGCKIRALNDRGDDSPEGELTDGILDQLAKYERAKTAERTRRGKLQRARQGKVVPMGSAAPYGFAYNAARTNFVVDEVRMSVVRRIFRMAANGSTLYGIQRAVEGDGIPSPRGGKYWNPKFIRDAINNDVYRPHTREEIETMAAEGRMSPEVAASLDAGKVYGIWYYNRLRVELTPGAASRRRFTQKPKGQWIPVPVPDAGVPVEEVHAARVAIKYNRPYSKAADRVWELHGVAYCACGRRMKTYPNKGYHYYTCQQRRGNGRGETCEHARYHRAEALEEAVASHVSWELLFDREALEAQMDEAIAREETALRNPDITAKAWAEKVVECDRKRAAYQDQQAAGLMSSDELRARLAQLEEQKATAERELARLREAEGRVEELKARKRAVLEMYGTGLMCGLEFFPPGLRRLLYGFLGLRVSVRADRTVHVEGDFDANVMRYTREVEEFAQVLKEVDRRIGQAPPEDSQERMDRIERELYALRGHPPSTRGRSSSLSYSFEVSGLARRSMIQSTSTRARFRLCPSS
jgi:site-specific DNA recombinase